MKRKPLVISVLMAVILLLGLSISALARDPADINLSFVEDSGNFVRTCSLLPEDAEDAEYKCDLHLLYGWLAVEEDGDFRYELDTENASVATAREYGQTLTEYVTFRYLDEQGAGRILSARFVIQPQEADAPAGSYALVNNGTPIVAEGNLFSPDDTQPDNEEPELVGVYFAGGEYMLNEELELTYSLSNWSRAVQQLAAGDQSVQLMKFRLLAEDGSMISRVVGITVSGVNDVPSVESATHALTMGSESDASGSALAGSVPGDGTAEQHLFAWATEASSAKYGTVVLSDDGSYSYTVNPHSDGVGGLTEGAEPLQEAFTYTYTDKDGSLAEGSVTFTVAYSDTSPSVLDQTATLTEDAGADDDDPCYVFEGSALTGSVPGNGTSAQHSFTWTDAAASDYGTVELNSDGSFSFRMDNTLNSVQQLYPGVDVQQTYGYTYTDVDGDIVTGSVIVTLKGANDVPRLQSLTHGFTEDSGTSADDPIYAHSGTVLPVVDSGDGAFTPSRFAWSEDNAAKYGVMTTNADGTYSYKLSNDSRAVQALKSGEEVNDVFSYSYTDANGDVATGSVTVTVTGAKDVPTVEAKNADLSLGGTVTATGNALENSTLGDGSEEDHVFAWTPEAIAAAENPQYGTMTLEDDGEYTYELDEDNEIVRSLTAGGDTLTEVFDFTYKNTQDTATASVTITIRYNDIHPVAAQVVRVVTEDGTSPLTGNVLSDCTPGNGVFSSHSFTWTSDAGEAQYGTVELNSDGYYSYTLDTKKCQSMKAGQTVSEHFSFTYRDADDDAAAAGSLTITINGVNDAPVWTGPEASISEETCADEGAVTNLSFLFKSCSDIEGDELVLTVEQQGTDTYASYTFNGSLFRFTPNLDNAAVRALTGDATLTVIYDVYISDGTARVNVCTMIFIIKAPEA